MARARSILILFLTGINLLGWGILGGLPGSSTLLYVWPWTGFCQVLFLLAVFSAFAAWAFRPPAGRPNVFSRLGFILLLAAMAASTVFSEYPGRAVLCLLPPLAAAALGLLVYAVAAGGWAAEKIARVIPAVLAALVLLVAARSVISWIEAFRAAPEALYGMNTRHMAETVNRLLGEEAVASSIWRARNYHPFGHPNHTAGFCLIFIPLFLFHCLRSRAWMRVLCGAALALLCLVLAATGTRSALALAGAFAGGLAGWRLWRTGLSRRVKIGGAAGIMAILIAAGALHPRARRTAGDLLESFSLEKIDPIRAQCLKPGFKMGLDAPWTGQGTGTVSLLFPRFWGGRGYFSNVYQLHNTPLQVWAEWGGAGLAGCLMLGVGFLLAWRRLVRHSQQHSGAAASALVHGAGFSVLLYTAFSLADYQLEVYAISGGLALLAGLMAGLEARLQAPDKAPSPRAGILRLGACVIVLAGLFWLCGREHAVWNARKIRRQAVSAYHENLPGRFEELLLAASRACPGEVYYLNLLAYGLREMARAPGREGLAQKAAVYWRESLSRNDWQDGVHYRLGWLLHRANPARAAFHFRRAAELNPVKRGVYFGWAAALSQAGNREATIRALALECLSQPGFILLPLWEEPVFRDLKPAVLEAYEGYHAELMNASAASAQAGRYLIRAGNLMRWWHGAAFAAGDFGAVFPPALRWFAQATEGGEMDPELAEKLKRKGFPPVFVYQAWKEPKRRGDLLKAAWLLTFKETSVPRHIESMERHLGQPGTSYAQLLRAANQTPVLPRQTVRDYRQAQGLLDRHPGGLVLEDPFIYENNPFLDMALKPLFPVRHHRAYFSGPKVREFIRELAASGPSPGNGP